MRWTDSAALHPAGSLWLSISLRSGSTVMELVANCMDWAQHRRRKAAAKLHLRLDTGSFLPACAIEIGRAHV